MRDIECRRYPRFPFHAHAVLVFPLIYLDVSLLDISMHGALIEVPLGRGFRTGACCKLRVLGTSGRQVMETDAVVARTLNRRQFGLEFRDISAGARRAVSNLVEMNLGSEALLRRDLADLLMSRVVQFPGSAAKTIGPATDIAMRGQSGST